tara:strand:- start:4877 stop:5116 length:240 start_codon:yes stop_codon:yes gene_type:complete
MVAAFAQLHEEIQAFVAPPSVIFPPVIYGGLLVDAIPQYLSIPLPLHLSESDVYCHSSLRRNSFLHIPLEPTKHENLEK